MVDLPEGKRLAALSLWVGAVVFSALLYLTGSYWKAILIGTFVSGSCVLGFGRSWVLRGSFMIAIVAIAVALGGSSPDEWSQHLRDARQAFFTWIPR
jgi:uncharacterized membrane protein YcfT